MKKYYQQGLLQRYFPELEDNEIPPQGWYDVTNIVNLEQMSFEEIEKALGIYVEPIFDLENAKQEKLNVLNDFVNDKFRAYLAKYPEVEQRSFDKKVEESLLVKTNPTIELSKTPYLTALTGNISVEARNKRATEVMDKVTENAQLEAFAVQTRDRIKTATTKEQLEAIVWE